MSLKSKVNSWMSLNPKKLKRFLFMMFGNKTKIALTIIKKTGLKKKWCHLDIDKIAKDTKTKPKKVNKVIRMLRKRGVYYTKRHGEYVKPTDWFVKKASGGLNQYLNKHKALKGQVEKAKKKDKQKSDKKQRTD